MHNIEKGWYKRGLEGKWWRGLVVILLWALISVAFLVPLSALMFYIAAIFDAQIFTYVCAGILIAGIVAVVVYFWVAFSSVFAEKIFRTGLNNVMKVGSKHFVKLLSVGVVLALPYLLYYFGVAVIGGFLVNDIVFRVVFILWGTFSLAFCSAYCMNWYVHEKNMMELQPVKRSRHAK